MGGLIELKRDIKTYLQVHVPPSILRYSFADTSELVDRDRVDFVVRPPVDVGVVEVEAVHTSASGEEKFGGFLLVSCGEVLVRLILLKF